MKTVSLCGKHKQGVVIRLVLSNEIMFPEKVRFVSGVVPCVLANGWEVAATLKIVKV